MASVSHNPCGWALWAPPQRSTRHSASTGFPRQEWGTLKCLCFLSRKMTVWCQGPDQGAFWALLGLGGGRKSWKKAAPFLCPAGSSPAINKCWRKVGGGCPTTTLGFLRWICVFQRSLAAAKKGSSKNCCHQRVCRRHNFCSKVFLKSTILSYNLRCCKIIPYYVSSLLRFFSSLFFLVSVSFLFSYRSLILIPVGIYGITAVPEELLIQCGQKPTARTM